MKMHQKAKYKEILILISSFFILFCNVKAQPISTKYFQFLEHTVETNESFWVRVHAAEALVLNNFTIDAPQFFKQELEKGGVEKIGVLRIIARINRRNNAKFDSIANQILHQFQTTPDEHEKLVALETMGKLGLYFPDKQIADFAKTGKGGIQTMAQWVLANSGNESELDALVDFLSSEDTLQFRYAAYSLRFIKNIPSHVYLKMEARLKSLNIRHPFRIYLLSALYVHAPGEDVFKDQLLTCLNGETYERYEVYAALSTKGCKEDITTIKESFSTEKNDDVKVAAANAFLKNEHFLQSKMGWIDWIILVIYGAFILAIGWYYSKVQKNTEDYFLGGRTVSSFFSGISLFVSFFSAITYLAIAGEVIKFGPLMALIVIFAAPVIYLLGSYFLIPFFMKLKIISAYEILEKPLGVSVRRIGSVLFLLTRLVWMALLIFLAAKAMIVMMGWENNAILLITIIIGAITVVYTTMGGIKAVLLTDVIQFFILLLGAVFTIVLISIKFGDVGLLIPTSWTQNWTRIDFISFDPYVRLTIVTAFINTVIWWVCTTGSDQMAIQRFLTTRSLKAARRSFMVTQVGQVSIYVLLMLVGFAIMQFYKLSPNLLPLNTNIKVDADFLFPHFIANQFPVGMSGLIIAALFSASMSSLSSGVNSVSSVFSSDILPAFLKKKSNTNNLKTIKIISALTGIVVIVLSLVIPLVPGNIIEVTYKTNGLFIAPLFNLFFNALFVKNAKPFGVIIGSIYGFLAALIIAFWDVITGNDSLSFLWIGIVSLLVSISVSIVVNLVMPGVRKKWVLLYGILLLLPWIIVFAFIVKS